MIEKLIKFLGLIFLMAIFSVIPFGGYINSAIVIMALWDLASNFGR